jgi:hypothetical protein
VAAALHAADARAVVHCVEGLAVLAAIPGVRSHRRFAPPLTHFTPDSRSESVPLFLKQRCDRALAAPPRAGAGVRAEDLEARPAVLARRRHRRAVAHRVLATGGAVIFMTPVCFVGKIPDVLYRGAGKGLYRP